MSYVLGLTGSIGMGKTTTAGFFRDAGVPVWDADAAVHRIYENGAASAGLREIVPQAVTGDRVDRDILRDAIRKDPALLASVEKVVHPLVATDRAAFLAENAEAPLLVCDIPLLFETGAQDWLDGVLVVTTDPETQRERVLARGTMDAQTFATILAKQMPDAEKRARADFVIDTGKGMEAARRDVLGLIGKITGN